MVIKSIGAVFGLGRFGRGRTPKNTKFEIIDCRFFEYLFDRD